MRQAQLIAAALLHARRRPRAPLVPLDQAFHPRTLDEGIDAQVALAGMTGAPAGFKIGATAKRMQEYLGLAGPAAGFMPEAGLHASGSTLAFDGFFRPGVECELAVRLSRDIAPGPCAAAAAEDAVDQVMPAIELVENRYADLAVFGAPAMVADQVFHAAAILGDPVADWRGIDLLEIEGAITVDGAVRGEGRGRELLGGPFEALAWLAQSAEAAAFGGLRAGQIVMLGSVCPPVWLDGPAHVVATFAGLGAVTLDLVAATP